MEKAKAEGKNVGRPVVVDKVDANLVVRLRSEGRSWREIAEAHPPGEGEQEEGETQRGVNKEDMGGLC